jgi:hypothetical protein
MGNEMQTDEELKRFLRTVINRVKPPAPDEEVFVSLPGPTWQGSSPRYKAYFDGAYWRVVERKMNEMG